MISFAEIVKKRKADLWVVVQNVPLPGGGSGDGDIIYQGPGSIEIARLLPRCYATYRSLAPDGHGQLYPVPAALGYKSHAGFVQQTHSLDIWEDSKTGCIYGNLGTGGQGYGLARVELADSAAEMSAPSWEEQTWERLQVSFRYAVQPQT